MNKELTENFSGDFISWLRTFYEVAKLRSFSRAAEVVERSQSTITYQIKKLEHRLGAELFNRKSSPVVLTEEGERLFGICQKLFNLLRQVSDQVGEGNELCGDIVIAANYGITAFYLPERIMAFRRQYPGVSIEVRPQPIGDLINSLYSPEIDLLLTQVDILPKSAVTYELFSANIALITPADWDIGPAPALEDFVRLPFIAFWKSYLLDREVLRAIQEKGYNLNIVQYGSFFLPILQYVSLGMGISIMDEFQARTPGFNVKVHSLAGMFPKRVYGLSHLPRRYLSPAVKKFMEFLLENRGRDVPVAAPRA